MVSLFVFYEVKAIWWNEEKSEKRRYGEPGNLKEEDFGVRTAGSLLSVTIKNKAARGSWAVTSPGVAGSLI